MKWIINLQVLFDKDILLKFKDMFYRVVARLTLLYRMVCVLVKNSHVKEMKILKCICGHAKKD